MKNWSLLFILILSVSAPCVARGQENVGEWPLAQEDTGKAEIDIRAVFKGKPLKMASQYYISPHGDTFYVDGFRFYITNISFIGNRSVTLSNSHLFDVTDTNTFSCIVKNIPPGVYNSVQFIMGVDSIANTSGANGGDLDPSKGMYWAWNSGYIMAKLEGHSNVCKTLHHAFEFHIGGYRPPYNTARTVTLKIPGPFRVGMPGMPRLTLTADAAAWFSNGLDLSKINSIVIPGKDAAMMADNYAKMFFIEDVSYTPLQR